MNNDFILTNIVKARLTGLLWLSLLLVATLVSLPIAANAQNNKISELGQYEGYTTENCLTNAHHPKSGEVIEFHICEEARKLHDETSFWERFY